MRFLFILILLCNTTFAQTVLYQDNCELTGYNWRATWTSPNVSYVTGNSATTDLPANSPLYVSSNRSILFQGVGNPGSRPERATISLPPVSINPTVANCFKMRIASMAINPTQNAGAGLDNQDNLRITVSYNGSATYSPEIQVNGGSDISWGYNAPGVIYRTAQGSLSNYAQVLGSEYSFITLELPVGTSLVAFEIDVGANASGETWLIDNFQLVGNCYSALPVLLTDYNCLLVNNNVIVKWTTLSETNNDFFIIEASNDLINIQEIGRVVGNGNSTDRINYYFTHYTPMNYYRLSQVDYDGTIKRYNWMCVDLKLKSFKLKTIYDVYGREVNDFNHGIYFIIDADGNSKKIAK